MKGDLTIISHKNQQEMLDITDRLKFCNILNHVFEGWPSSTCGYLITNQSLRVKMISETCLKKNFKNQ
jgi:hypothetical protein